MPDAAGLFDEEIDGLGGSVVGAGVEVGEELGPPGPQCAAQADDLGDRAGREACQHVARAVAPFGWAEGVVDSSELLDACTGDGDFRVRVAEL